MNFSALPKILISLFLSFFATACATQTVDLITPSPSFIVMSGVTTTPLPTPFDKTPTVPTVSPTFPQPTPDTEALVRNAAKLLEPYLSNAPYLSTDPLASRRYYGCVNNASAGGYVFYDAIGDLDAAMQSFEQFFADHSIKTTGWKAEEMEGTLGKFYVMSGRRLSEKELPELLIKAMLQNFGVADHPEFSQPNRSKIHFNVTLIANMVNSQDEENYALALNNNCPQGQTWLHNHPEMFFP